MNEYMLKGVKGFLLEVDNPKVKNINPIDSNSYYGFYSLEQISGIDINEKDTKLEYFDEHNGQFSSNEIVLNSIVNPENKQTLISEVWVNKDLFEDDLYERELLIETNKFYEWESERTKFIRKIMEYKLSREEAEKEWDEIIKDYNGLNHYSEPALFDDLWKELEL